MKRSIAAGLACVAWLAVPAAAGTSSESVSLSDFALSLPQGAHDAGTWTFSAINAGRVSHGLRITRVDDGAVIADAGTIAPQTTAILQPAALTPGLYAFVCPFHPQAMRSEVGFRGVGSATFGTIRGVSDRAASVPASATANGDTGATAVLTLAAGPSFIDRRTTTTQIGGFAAAEVGSAFVGLLPDTTYRVEVHVHGDRGTSPTRQITFTTRRADVRAPTVRIVVPVGRGVRQWTTIRGVVSDPAPSNGITRVEVSVLLRRGKACQAFRDGRFVPARCHGPASWTRVAFPHGSFTLALAGLRAGDLTVRARALDLADHTGFGATVTARLHA